jgi:hypothetical protein
VDIAFNSNNDSYHRVGNDKGSLQIYSSVTFNPTYVGKMMPRYDGEKDATLRSAAMRCTDCHGAEEQDIVSETSLVIGMPEDTVESIRETVELAKYFYSDLSFFLAIAPWPYSEIYPQLKDYIVETDYHKYNLVVPVLKPKNMTLEEVSAELGRASREFYRNKIDNLDSLIPKKKKFMIKVVHIIATNSYLADTMKGTSMPQDVQNMLEKLNLKVNI